MFLWKYVGYDQSFKSLWNVCQIVLVLSHGQATIEWGFSENEIPLVDNLHMESLIAQRQVCDFMKNKA